MTGARPGEACRLRWDHIRWKAGVIEYPTWEHKTGTATAESRTIYLTPKVTKLLEVMRAIGVRSDRHVFGHNRGPWNPTALVQKFRLLRNRLTESKIVPYSMRHAYCTDAIMAGLSYADLGKLVGNSPATLERHYDHPVRDLLRERAAEFERARYRS